MARLSDPITILKGVGPAKAKAFAQLNILTLGDLICHFPRGYEDRTRLIPIEKLGYKIREAQMQKIPYMLVIGDRDMENGTVSVRTRKGEDLGAMTPDEFIAKCLMEIATKSKEV